MWRHGDLLIRKIERIPNKAKKKVDKVLEEGEVTGHTHRVTGKAVTVLEEEDTCYIDAPNGTTVVHEEHESVELPPGVFSVWRQREYNPYEEAIRYVQD